MNESFNKLNQKLEKSTIMEVMRQIGFPVTETVVLGTADQQIIESTAQDSTWQAGLVFGFETEPNIVREEARKLRNTGYEVKVNRVHKDDNDEQPRYVLLFRKNEENVDKELLPPSLLHLDDQLPDTISKLIMSRNLKKMLYKDTTEVSEKEQIKTLLSLGHKIMFQEVGEVHGTKEGLYYLQNEEQPEFDFSGGDSLTYAIKKVQDHIDSQHI